VSLKRIAPLLVIAGLLGAAPAEAQFEKDWKSWYGQVGLGYSLPQADAGDAIEDDLWWTGGATYYPEQWPVGSMLELAYSNYDIRSDVLDCRLPDRGSRATSRWSTASAVRSPGSPTQRLLPWVVSAPTPEATLSAPGYLGAACLALVVRPNGPRRAILAGESATEFGFNLGSASPSSRPELGDLLEALPPHGTQGPELPWSMATAGGSSGHRRMRRPQVAFPVQDSSNSPA
jgi:hypothetical protein